MFTLSAIGQGVLSLILLLGVAKGFDVVLDFIGSSKKKEKTVSTGE